MGLANNHAMDFGAEGRASSRQVLDSMEIAHSGEIGDSGSGDARETHGNSDPAPPGGLAPPGATQVTGLLPHDGRGLPAGD